MSIKFQTKDNYHLSPFTGWTRERWIELAEKMILGIQRYLTLGKGGVALPNPVRWMDAFLPDPKNMESFYWMEGFTRSRLLLTCWMVGTGKTVLKIDNASIDILDQFIEGLLSVSDPGHPEFIGNRYGNNQWIAETSAVAYAFYLGKDIFWPRMNQKERQQIIKWMQNSTGHKIPHNNWYLFVANTNLVLKSLGYNYNREEVETCLKQIRSFYLGDGWFMDGDKTRGFSVDQYNAWGFHYFLPAFLKMSLEDEAVRKWIVDALRRFVTRFYWFFGANGAFPMWGRSWIYRPALTTAFLWAELLGISPLNPGETRRLVSGQMKFYVENAYFQKDFTPTMGYVGENLNLIDPYSQYGSAYWGSSVFLCLLMEDKHPYWTTIEQPLPVERKSYCREEPAIGIQVMGNQHTGEVQIINHQLWHQREGPGTRYAKKYTNFAYSTHFGIDLRRDSNGYNNDNMISVSPDGKKFSHRIIPYFIKLDKDYGASFHYPLSGFPFIEVEDPTAFSGDSNNQIEENQLVKITTQILLRNFLQIRIHTVETKLPLTAVREGGFTINYKRKAPDEFKDDMAIGFHNGLKGAFIKSLWGFNYTCGQHSSNSNTLSGKSVIPMLVGGSIKSGKHVYISLSGTWFAPPEEIYKRLQIVKRVKVDSKQIEIYFSDGSEYSFHI